MTASLNPNADGLNIDPDFGVISGTPAEDAIQSGPYVVAVTMDDGDGGSTTQTFDWTVADSTMTLQGDAISQQAGAGVDTFQVATFTDPDLNRQASDYATTINWGDGQTSQGEVDGGNGAYTVSGDHVYLHPGAWALQVTVTDPAGGTATAATAATTASVTPAPLTATGNLQDGATSGLATTFTVATFSDANGYAAASSYTATINRGDGTATTTGVIDGADGAFRVTGNHSYAYDGTYSVSVTVTDADGATTTTTSQITAGDIQAGLDNTLTVASFTSADPNATAASFTAMIQWGDGGIMMGGTAGTVVQEGNQFVVLGAHAFQAAGVYTVQVTVTDLSGDQLTGSDTVQAAPAPAMGFGGDLAAQDGYVSDAALALFTLPQGYGALGQYTATADWGDGTSSAVSLANNGGIWEALGDHGYSGPGQYAVKTLVYNAALQVVAAAVTLVDAIAKPEIIGPTVVPGWSEYLYQVKNPGSKVTSWSLDSGLQQVAKIVWESGDETEARVAFLNTPADGHVEANVQGNPKPVRFEVTVVQVGVGDPPASDGPAFQPGNVDGTGKAFDNKTTIDGKVVDGPKKNIAVGTDEAPGLQWAAGVVLRAPPGKAAAIKKINVGFVQQVYFTQQNVTFPSAVLTANIQEGTSRLTVSTTGAPMLKPYYTDTVYNGGVQPELWYSTRDYSFYEGSNETNNFKILRNGDVPNIPYPILFNGQLATSVSIDWNFVLTVAATTTDQGVGGEAANEYIREASVNWSFDGSSDLSPNGTKDVNWTGVVGMDPPAAVDVTPKPQTGTWWRLPTKPAGSVAQLSDPTTEDVLHPITWKSSKKP